MYLVELTTLEFATKVDGALSSDDQSALFPYMLCYSTLARFCRHHRKHYIGPVSVSEKSWLVQVFPETTPTPHLVRPSKKSAPLPLSQSPYFWTFQNTIQDHRVDETVSTCHGFQRRGSAVEPISGSRHAEPPHRGVNTPRSTGTSSLVVDEHISIAPHKIHKQEASACPDDSQGVGKLLHNDAGEY